MLIVEDHVDKGCYHQKRNLSNHSNLAALTVYVAAKASKISENHNDHRSRGVKYRYFPNKIIDSKLWTVPTIATSQSIMFGTSEKQVMGKVFLTLLLSSME